MREKLIDILTSFYGVDPIYFGVEAQQLADHLIANGVTFAKDNNVPSKWIPVTERLPEKRDDVLLCRKWWNEIRNPQMGWYNYVSRSWFDLSNREIHNVTHWMPLPEPPKGE